MTDPDRHPGGHDPITGQDGERTATEVATGSALGTGTTLGTVEVELPGGRS